MIRGLISVALLLAACDPAPRDVTWFEAHPDDAKKTLAQCAEGARNAECENARSALNRLKANARKERYRQGFE
ncbi:EexN family lipoprotein [Phenylobacterium sp.]|uniref:EexN family lipoprotein n=1 Tax=Phenylobacterium sp. TaxID=1871053 RepID=UPI0025E94CD6|nr:EexN family lipoprotein [Phenylobacterium sp.]